jgi:N-acetylglutamate synthase-like GNAT family acetyltransferase
MLNPLTKAIYQQLVSKLRHLKEGLYTNFFWNDAMHSLWIDHDELLFTELSSRSVILVRKNDGFSNLYYITTNISDLKDSLNNWLKTQLDVYVCDIVGRECDIVGFKAVFEECGFSERRMLQRMIKPGGVQQVPSVCDNIVYATDVDIPAIEAMLHKYFDKYSEQLPKPYELAKQVAQREIILYKDKDAQGLGGLIMFDNMKVSMHLRFWIVAPEYRDKHVGSTLFNAMMYECREAKRQMHWVVADNENAIKRYLHYGYKFDGLNDIILIKE